LAGLAAIKQINPGAMLMPSNQDLQMIADRGLSALNEIKANAVQLAQLGQQIREAQSTLAGLQGQIEAAKKLAPQLEQFDGILRAKRVELADLEATIAKKHADHGAVDSALRDLRKQISGDPSHA
jgi:chromosome segregation ATPase